MYCTFFGFSGKPFDVSPDPAFLYLSPTHREMLATLIYGIRERRGIIAVMGEVGTGKTTLLHALLSRLDGKTRTACIFNTTLTFDEMLTTALLDLNLARPDENLTKVQILHRLREFALRQLAGGGNVVLLVDEAQNLDAPRMENLRLLSNCETPKHKLIQIVLSGQPELDAKLNQPELRQLTQRIALKRYITPLTQEETYEYIQHRLRTVNYNGSLLFDHHARELIWEYSSGVPRKINVLCDNALLIAYALQQKSIGTGVVEEAIRDLSWSPYSRTKEVHDHPDQKIGPVPPPVRNEDLPVSSGNGSASGPTTLAPTVSAVPVAAPRPSPLGIQPPLPSHRGLGTSTQRLVDRAIVRQVSRGVGEGLPRRRLFRPVRTVGLGLLGTVSVWGLLSLTPVRISDLRPVAGTRNVLLSARPTRAVEAPPAGVKIPGAKPGVGPVRGADESQSAPVSRLADLLADPSTGGDDHASFASLYTRWGIDPQKIQGTLGCNAKNHLGLECFFQVGNWTRLRHFDLPALLELQAPGGEQRWAALVELGEQTATLELNGRAYSFPLPEIEKLWDGSFILLWKPPPFGLRLLVPGMHGPDVAWVRRTLDEMKGKAAPSTPSDVYDAGLERRVLAFQRSRALLQDGLVGKETLLRLSLALRTPETPSLSHPAT